MKTFLKVVITIFMLGSLFFLWQETKKKVEKTNPEKENIQEPKEEVKELSPEEEKLLKLNNINQKLDYFNKNYLDRYITYKEAHPNETLENIITYVNIGIDQPLYSNIKESPYLDTIYVIANKYIKLPKDYKPNNLKEISLTYSIGGMYLVENAKEAFEELAKTAKEEGYTIRAMSTYRSYTKQENLYNGYVQQNGVEATDKDTARPGHSEHQTGLSVDVDNSKISYNKFETTNEFTWMQNNAYKYGFILRYPKGKEFITGYVYESWHYRYVGKEIANYIHEHNITFDEYYVKFIEGKK